VIVETFVSGSDFRLLVVNYRFVAAALRTPACVVGDGRPRCSNW
jgi:cyanophycin synthetase